MSARLARYSLSGGQGVISGRNSTGGWAMPDIDDGATPRTEKPGGEVWRAVRLAAIVIAIAPWLGACSPGRPPAPAPAPGAVSRPAIAVQSLPPAAPGPSINEKPLAGPIALAPSMTGAPPAASAPPALRPEPPAVSATPAAPAPPTPAPAPVAMPAPPPAPAVGMPAPAPIAATPQPSAISCPPGATAVWSEPDLAGTPVAICRRLPTGR